jgi:hypothetical protein
MRRNVQTGRGLVYLFTTMIAEASEYKTKRIVQRTRNPTAQAMEGLGVNEMLVDQWTSGRLCKNMRRCAGN